MNADQCPEQLRDRLEECRQRSTAVPFPRARMLCASRLIRGDADMFADLAEPELFMQLDDLIYPLRNLVTGPPTLGERLVVFAAVPLV